MPETSAAPRRNARAIPADAGAANGRKPGRRPAKKPAARAEAKPIWQLFEEAARSLPQEEIDRAPTDLSEQHDHYLYGSPKT